MTEHSDNISDEASEGSRVVAASLLSELFLDPLLIDGVSLSVFDSEGHPTTLHASDDTAAHLDDVQFDLGEGPLFTVHRTTNPVFIDSVKTDPGIQWPMFIREAQHTAAGALFVVPLMMGAVSIGVVSMYRREAGKMSNADIIRAASTARTAAAPALRAAALQAEEEIVDGSVVSFALRRDVHQAVGMVLAQLNVSATDAFARLRARAYSEGLSLHSVAQDVLTHKLDFSLLSE